MSDPAKILAAIRKHKKDLGDILSTDDEFESLHEEIINLLKAAKRNKGEYKEFVEYPPKASKLWFETDGQSKSARQDQLKKLKEGILALLNKLEKEYSTLVELQ